MKMIQNDFKEKPFCLDKYLIENCASFAEIKLALWKAGCHLEDFPFNDIVYAYHEVGKHFVPSLLLEQLNNVRDILREKPGTAYREIIRFLDVLLDKHDGKYDYRSYLALSLLDLPDEEVAAGSIDLSWDKLNWRIALMLSDIVKFELEALDGVVSWLPQVPPSPELVSRRCRLALKALSHFLGTSIVDFGIKHECPSTACRVLIKKIESLKSIQDRARLQRSMLPVYRVHDEYLFIRILQCFETTFSWIAANLQQNALNIFSEDTAGAAKTIADCEENLKNTITFLFPILSSMQPEAFKNFRRFTEGASAIQSRNYKKVESLCRKPDDARLNSIAYESVPDVQESILSDYDNLDSAYRAAKDNSCFSLDDLAKVKERMRSFESSLIRWRKAHYGIAVRMLGEGTGTGYTEGTPYLKAIRDIPVFKEI